MFEREIRDLSFVPRWTTVRAIHRQSVAEHSLFVAIYADQIATFINWSGDRTALLRYALWHDVGETISGDIPGPVKRAMGIRDSLEAFNASHLMRRFPMCEWIDPVDSELRAIVKVANCAEELFWLASEIQMGNQTMGRVFDDAHDRMTKCTPFLPTDDKTKLVLRHAIHDAAIDHRGGSSKIVTG